MPELIDSFLKEVGSKYANIQIKDKNSSWLMKTLNRIVSIFNPRFDRYITTIGTTIYTPTGFMDKNPVRTLETISHETRHVMDFKQHPILYVLGYGFPQILAIPLLILLLVLGCGWWSLFALALLAPIPSYWRYKAELRAYRTSLLLGKHVYKLSDKELQATKDWIVMQMTERWYYWAWPFPGSIRKDLEDSSYELEPFYVDLLDFCKRHQVQL